MRGARPLGDGEPGAGGLASKLVPATPRSGEPQAWPGPPPPAPTLVVVGPPLAGATLSLAVVVYKVSVLVIHLYTPVTREPSGLTYVTTAKV